MQLSQSRTDRPIHHQLLVFICHRHKLAETEMAGVAEDNGTSHRLGKNNLKSESARIGKLPSTSIPETPKLQPLHFFSDNHCVI